MVSVAREDDSDSLPTSIRQPAAARKSNSGKLGAAAAIPLRNSSLSAGAESRGGSRSADGSASRGPLSERALAPVKAAPGSLSSAHQLTQGRRPPLPAPELGQGNSSGKGRKEQQQQRRIKQGSERPHIGAPADEATAAAGKVLRHAGSSHVGSQPPQSPPKPGSQKSLPTSLSKLSHSSSEANW